MFLVCYFRYVLLADFHYEVCNQWCKSIGKQENVFICV